MGVWRSSPTYPEVATADSGYFSAQAMTDERLDGIELLVATGRERKAAPASTDPQPNSVAIATLMGPADSTANQKPEFPQAGWDLVAWTHDLLKLSGSGWSTARALNIRGAQAL